MVIHVTFAGVLVLEKDAQPLMKWIFEFIFLKHANDGITLAIFGYNREQFICEEMYCHFQRPEKFLQMIDAPKNAMKSFYVLPIIMLFMHVLSYLNMNNRLKRS